MGWEMWTGNPKKPQIYNYYYKSHTDADGESHSSGTYDKANPGYYSWMLGTRWSYIEPTIKFINDTGNRLKIGRIAIKTVACNSGGNSYWAYGYKETVPCKGYAGNYYCYVRVSNDGGSTYQESTKPEEIVHVLGVNGPNYDTLGTQDGGATTGYSASFGNSSSLPDAYRLRLHDYTITDCPIIEPGSICHVHLHISNFIKHDGGDVTNLKEVNIRFILNPLEMEVEFEPEDDKYIWVFGNDRQWHLTKPLQLMTGDGWVNVDNQ